ncbi:hypothetical protein D7V86_00715 [bacterium D16-51]|nr:hypothetical protein D7V96_04610 [bacterium D16-59]RKI62755.1 hypothetical protein D7V86_00715 [bacterium D16-51]
MMKKICSVLVTFSLIIGLFVVQGRSAEAGAPGGIAGNGTGGISIDINAAPYTDYANIPNWGQYAYGASGCAWFASARVNQLTGANCTIYSGKSWYNSAYATFGFSRGSVLNAKALACYENHVAVVESVNGDKAVVSEGGYTSVNASNGYCVIHELSKAQIESARGGGFLGYVYLTGGAPQPAAGLSYSNLHTTFVDTWNAGLYGYIDNPGRLTVSEVGVFIWDSAGTLVVNHKENCGLKTSYVEQQLNIVGEALPSGLKSGESYTYQMYAVANGTTYKSDIGTFTIVDNEKPKVSNVEVSDVSSDGYTVSCVVTDNHDVALVKFPVWTYANGQDDLQKDWVTNSKYSGIKDGDKYTFRVNISDHNNESGIYRTEIYAWDKAGNQSDGIAVDTEVPEKNKVPEPTPEVVVSPSPAPATEPPFVQTPTITPEPDNVQSSNYLNSYVTNLADTSVTLKATIPLQYMEEWGVYFGKNPSNLKRYFGNTPDYNVTSMTFSFTEDIFPDTTYYYYFYYSTGTKTAASKLYSFTTNKSNSSSNRDFESVMTTNLTDTEASFKVTIPSCYVDSCGYYFGTDSNNLQKNVIANPGKNISWMTFARNDLSPNTTYYFYIYYVTETRTVVSKLYQFTTEPGKSKPSEAAAPEKVVLYTPYSNKKKTMYVEWRMDSNADGYQIQYSTDKRFKSAKKVTVASWNVNSKKITKLKSKKRYYVRIRAYKNSAGNKLYGEWSVVKSCKIK